LILHRGGVGWFAIFSILGGAVAFLKGYTGFFYWEGSTRAPKPDSLFIFHRAFTEEMGRSHRLSWSIAQAQQQQQQQQKQWKSPIIASTL
jgi:hypothetical protein